MDEFFPDTPIIIWHTSGHGGYTNTKGFEKKGITKDTPNPTGGEFAKDENGELNGFLRGESAFHSVGHFPEINLETNMDSAKFHARNGFTTASEEGITSPFALKLMQESTQNPDFPVRVIGGLYYSFPGLYETATHISSYESDLFKVPHFKMVVDGSSQNGSSFFSEPFYNFDADTNEGAHGTQEELNEEIFKAMELGFGPHVHANGDAAMEMALNAIDYARKKLGNSDVRASLVHCQYVRDDQFDRIAEMGNIGMTFFPEVVYFWGDMHREQTLGPKRAAHEYSIQGAAKRGIPYGIHSDAPVAWPNALHAMWVAVNRLTSSGFLQGADERITPEQALIGYTSGAAWLVGMEDQIGTLEVGKMADYVVLAEDPLTIDPIKIKDIKIIATVMNGRATHVNVNSGHPVE